MLTYTNHPHRQRGAVLIVSLLLLFVLTVLGITAMRTTTLEEQMAGGIMDSNRSFEAAEAGLRAGEELLEDINALSYPIRLNTQPNEGTYHWRDWDRNNTSAPHSIAHLVTAGEVGNLLGQWPTVDMGDAQLSAAPVFAVEQLEFSPPPPRQQDLDSLASDRGANVPEDQMFRVVSIGRGTTPNSEAWLETTVRTD